MSRIVAVALVLLGVLPDPGGAYQNSDCRSVAGLSPAAVRDSLRTLYISGKVPPLPLLECAESISQDSDQRLRRHVIDHARIVLRQVKTLHDKRGRIDQGCKTFVHSIDCELKRLSLQQVFGRLLTDLLANPAEPESPEPAATRKPETGDPLRVAGKSTESTRSLIVMVPVPIMVRTDPRSNSPDPIDVATTVAAGPSVVAAGVRADFPAIMSVPLSAGLEYIDYMRRPAGLLVSAGMRRRSLAIMLGLSVGAGRPDPWVSLTADTSFGVHVGLLVGPAVGVRIGS